MRGKYPPAAPSFASGIGLNPTQRRARVHLPRLPTLRGGGGGRIRGGGRKSPHDRGGGGPEWSIGSSSKGPHRSKWHLSVWNNESRGCLNGRPAPKVPRAQVSGAFPLAVSPLFPRICGAQAKIVGENRRSRGQPELAAQALIEGGPTISPYFTGSRGVFSRASAGHKRKSLVKIGEVAPRK